jgi:hypothetical protein
METDILAFVGIENLLVLLGTSTQDVLPGPSIVGRLAMKAFMGVVETLRVGSKCEPSQISAWKSVRQPCSSFDVEQLEFACAFSAFLYFIQKKPTVRRNPQRLYRGVVTRTAVSRINQKLFFTICTVSKIDAKLFLSATRFLKKYRFPTF